MTSGMSPHIDEMSDEQVVIQALQIRDMFAVLVRRYQDRLTRYIRRLGLLRREDAEDVLQNIFLKAYRNLNGFNTELRFSSWIYRIAHNETISFFRAKNARPEVLPDPESDIIERIPADLDIALDADRSVEGARLRQAIAELEPKYRDVLLLRYFEERDYAEISDVLQKPPGTVATLLNRGKQKLKAILQEQDRARTERQAELAKRNV
jgi:RNA polymerase sigma-70 factor (ECF subfamily)